MREGRGGDGGMLTLIVHAVDVADEDEAAVGVFGGGDGGGWDRAGLGDEPETLLAGCGRSEVFMRGVAVAGESCDAAEKEEGKCGVEGVREESATRPLLRFGMVQQRGLVIHSG